MVGEMEKGRTRWTLNVGMGTGGSVRMLVDGVDGGGRDWDGGPEGRLEDMMAERSVVSEKLSDEVERMELNSESDEYAQLATRSDIIRPGDVISLVVMRRRFTVSCFTFTLHRSVDLVDRNEPGIGSCFISRGSIARTPVSAHLDGHSPKTSETRSANPPF
jgi:hypothetical protein